MNRGALRFISVVALMLSVAPLCEAAAQENDVPPIVLSGLKTYRAESPEAALKTWAVGGPMEGADSLLSQATTLLRQIESRYGKYREFDLIKEVNLTPTTKIVYLQMNFQKGPLFARFVCYLTELNWVIATVDFHTKPELILPPSLLGGSSKE